jgi:hypothetical protein
LVELQRDRQRQTMETEEMQRMLCELEEQRNQIASEAEELKYEINETMSKSINASVNAERDSNDLAVLVCFSPFVIGDCYE